MFTGTNLTYTKAYNFRIVFETIRLTGPISRAEIARRTNLTAQTVSNIVARLLEQNFIREGKKLQKERGAPSTNLIVNPDGAYSIGIDYNRDHLTGILVNLEGNVVSKYFYEADNPQPEEAVRLIADTIRLLKKFTDDRNAYLAGVGIGLPGPLSINENNEVSNTNYPNVFPNWLNIPIVELLSEKINTRFFIENNASAAAIGELWYGAGKNKADFLYVFLGAGLGGGVVLNGSIYDGAHGNAGELGYFQFTNAKSPLSSEKEPHIGEHFSLTNLYNWLSSSNVIVKRPEDLEKLFLQKHPMLMDWMKLAKEYLSPILLGAEYYLDLGTIILGGRLPEVIIQDFTNDLPMLLNKNRFGLKSNAPKMICGTTGPDAAALGAATLPIFDLFSVQKEVLLKN